MTTCDIESGSANRMRSVGEKPFALLDVRKKLSTTASHCVNVVLKFDLLLRIGVIVGIWFSRGKLPYDLGFFGCWEVLLALQLETVCMSFFLLRYARWENQEHWITVWQTLGVVEVILIRMALFVFPLILLLAFFGLWLTYFVGIWAEFTKDEEVRLPPFVPKKDDVLKPQFGWLGDSLSKLIPRRFRIVRLTFTLFIYLSWHAFTIFIVYVFFVSFFDDLRDLPTFHKNDNHTLYLLLWVSVFAGVISTLPFILLEVATIPGLVSDWRQMKRASRSYQTGVFDVCEIDGDDDDGSELKKKMKEHPEGILPLTLVLPCYMPNESEIMPPILDWYEQQLMKYPAESRVLIVWNSPVDHPFEADVSEVTRQMEERKQKWAQWKLMGKSKMELQFERCPWSTSKCDNLNMACDSLIETEICCLNDADTILDWATMVRGSYRIHSGYDIAQASNTHNRFDRNGTPVDENLQSFHPFGIGITISDATKPRNVSTQTSFSHAPFNGRGGFWKTASVKQVGFDHRTIGEDHDAGYRGCAYFGFKGVLDPNMICQEQEPPDCKALTNQRIRWETAALEMRRTFSWILRSPSYSLGMLRVALESASCWVQHAIPGTASAGGYRDPNYRSEGLHFDPSSW
jgi:hypothetical protein